MRRLVFRSADPLSTDMRVIWIAITIIVVVVGTSGCDPFFELRREIASPTVNEACAHRSLDLVPGQTVTGTVKPLPQHDGRYQEHWISRPGAFSVSLLLDGEAPSVATLQMATIGRAESPEVVNGVALLEDVQTALFSACGITPSSVVIRETRFPQP
jgi:hypothetical protein